MTVVGKLYGNEQHPRVTRTLAAAKINGVEIELVPTTGPTDGPKPEYLAKFPMGMIPAFEGTDGFKLTETRAVARYIAGLSANASLLGTDAQSSALVSQWSDWADDEILVKGIALWKTNSGATPYTKPQEQKCWDALHRSFKYLENYLKKQTFLVGHRITLADLCAADGLKFTFTRLAGPEFREQYPNTVRYYETVTNQSAIQSLYKGAELATANSKFTPPPKEAKAKAAPAAAAVAAGGAAVAGGAAAAASKKDKKKKDDDDEEEEEKHADPPAKHPLASLPPTTFILDEAKRNYSNWETPDFLKWFYEHFDKAGYSIWRFDFKYNEELSLVFMSSNQISGFFDRLEASRKYIMGSGVVFGENNNSKIAGVVISRGSDYKDSLGVAPDLESYVVTPLNPFDKSEDKEFFEKTLAWEGEVDGLKAAVGKFLK